MQRDEVAAKAFPETLNIILPYKDKTSAYDVKFEILETNWQRNSTLKSLAAGKLSMRSRYEKKPIRDS